MSSSTSAAIVFALCSFSFVNSYYVVYNLRISQLTRRQATQGVPSLLTTTLFQQWYKHRDGLKADDTGILVSYIHTRPSWYIKIDAALAHVHVLRPDCTELKRNQTDDLLLSGGYGIQPHEGSRMSFSGYFGIPTHKDTALDNIEFGSGHYSLGAQADGSQAYTIDKPHFLLWAVRSLYFFPRAIRSDDPTIMQRYILSPGVVVDLYVAHQSNWNELHRIEFGYDCTFSLGTKVRPIIANFNPGLPFVRNTYFVSYIRKIQAFGKPSSLLFTLTNGIDKRPRCVGRKYGISLFFSWAINF